MHDYPNTARVWWWLATITGVVAFIAAVVGTLRFDPGVYLAIIVGIALAAVAGLVPVTIPGTKMSVSSAEIPIFLLLLACGPAAAVVAAAVEAACISLRTTKRWTSRVASPAMAAVAMSASGHFYTTTMTALASGGSPSLTLRLIVLCISALVFFVAGTLMVATLLCLKRGEAIRPIKMLRGHAWLGLGYGCSALIAGLLHASFVHKGVGMVTIGIMLTAALLAMLHLYYRNQPVRSA